ncbi:MAG: hypothetical protein GC159_13495 [Phycisphaera sp.]|nr:hypothetical protein [Phycisphaera sp.]
MPTDHYILSDTLYRSVAVFDDTGAIEEAYDTDAYGNTLIFTAAGTGGNWWADDATQADEPSCDFIFTGRRYDPESEIYFYRRRYYVPDQGRFISKDPIGYMATMNLFEYANSEPTRHIDPTGTQSIEKPDVKANPREPFLTATRTRCRQIAEVARTKCHSAQTRKVIVMTVDYNTIKDVLIKNTKARLADPATPASERPGLARALVEYNKALHDIENVCEAEALKVYLRCCPDTRVNTS